MTRQLVLVHGRSQGRKDSVQLKAEWIAALKGGLAKSALTLPIGEADIRFPYYGATLDDLVAARDPSEAAEVVVRGEDADDDEKRFMRAILEEVRLASGVTTDQLAEVSNSDVVERGPQNWAWVQAIVSALDRNVPGASGASIALATHDVYVYLRNPAVRDTIEAGVSAALTPGVEAVVVGHSLGSVVAYNVLRTRGQLMSWNVPLLVTVGSPLAVAEIRKTLRSIAPMRIPECTRAWYNAVDNRDIVALYPLAPDTFPIDPAIPPITNQTNVQNRTPNRHGISGYLGDPEVAQTIYDALTSS